MITIVINNPAAVQRGREGQPCSRPGGMAERSHAHFEGKGGGEPREGDAAAGKLFRERGLEGVGVDALAEAAGLTHGAVYSHFKSKDELAAEALRQALHQSMTNGSRDGGLAGADGFEKL